MSNFFSRKKVNDSVQDEKAATKIKIMEIISKRLFTLVFFFVIAASEILILQLFGTKFDTVISPSMSPAIPVGSLVITVPTDFAKIEVGNDVTYRIGGSKVTHRVIGKDPDAKLLYTQGLANKDPDGAVSESQLVGKVVLHIPLIGYLLLFLSTLKGKILAVVWIVTFAAISALLEFAAKSIKANGSV